MARPNKTGLDYFPLDVDFHDDDKVALLTAEFNVMAEAIIIRLLCKIYKNGYYYAWGDDERLLFCRWAGGVFVPNQVEEVVKGCLRRSFFDKGVFEAFGILTSPGIQKRFMQASQERKSIDIIADYWLLDIPSDDRFNIIRSNNGVNPPNNGVNPPNKYIKKSKLNISSPNVEDIPPYNPPKGKGDDIPAEFVTLWDNFRGKRKSLADDYKDFCKKTEGLTVDYVKLQSRAQVAKNVYFQTWLNDFFPKKSKRNIDISAVEPTFQPIVADWLEYKSERGQTYRQKGFDAFYSRLRTLSDGDPHRAREIIEQSKANNWAGIFALGNGLHGNGTRTSGNQTPSDDDLARAVAEGWARAHTRQDWEQ